MDALPAEWLCELGMEDPNDLVHECHMNSAIPTAEEFDFHTFSPESYRSSLNLVGTPAETSQASVRKTTEKEQLKTNSWDTYITENITEEEQPISHLMSFGQLDSPSTHLQQLENLNCTGKSRDDHEMMPDEYTNLTYLNSHGSDDNPSDTLDSCKRTRSVHTLSRPPLQAKHHVMAERKRREKLNQKLIALSALIPGLKKMDKASILGDATKYIKQLEERVQTLEGDAKKRKVEPATLSVKRSRLSSDDESCSSEENFDGESKQVPEIEVRVSNKHALVRVHCKKQDGVIAKLLSELEKFSLNVISSSIVPFGETAIDITIIAQMSDEHRMKVKDLEKYLRSAVVKLM